MKIEWRKIAPAGLYLSLLAVLASAGLYIVQRKLTLPLEISLGLIVIGLALFALMDPDAVRRFLTGRQARYGSNALVLILAFVGVVVVINYLVYQNSKRWDLTEDKVNTLAPETLSTLGKLQEPVLAEAFYTKRLDTTQAKNLLDQYKFNGKGKFNYKFIDPEADPVAAQNAKITQDGTIVLVMNNRQQEVRSVQEQDLTGGLVRLMNPQQQTVYFLTGHGEASIDGTDNTSFSQAKGTLTNKGYIVQTLNLLTTNKIPDNAKVIVIPGPKKPLSQSEVDLLSQFLAKGGGLIVMEDSPVVTDFGDQADPLADWLTKDWGVKLGKDLIIDQTSNQPTVAIGSQWGDHQITTNLKSYVAVMPTSRSVTLSTAPSGITQSILVSTSPQSWAETNLTGLKANPPQANFDQGADLMGPVPISVVGEKFDTKSRLVVFGDADFVSDAFYTAYGNGDLFVNSVDWAAGEENLISLTPKSNTQRLVVPPQAVSMNLILLLTVIVMPGLALVGGIVVWVQRSRRG